MEFSVENPLDTQISFSSESSKDFKIPENIASPTLMIFVAIVGIFSIVMIYHWFAYGRNKILSLGTTIIYVCGVLFLTGMIIQLFIAISK